MNPMRILGIDPGFDRLGVCVLDKEGTKETLVTSLGIVTSKTESFEDRLLYLANGVEKLIQEYKPTHLAKMNL
jgi:Holliday junction resolvasome RuvABC endonuclease subunit